MNTSVKDIICKRKSVRTFSGKSLRPEDRQKLDALAHFDLTLKESGVVGRFVAEDPGFAADDQLEYIVTCEVDC